MTKLTNLPEVAIYDGQPVRDGVYKRKVFVQGNASYARFENGRWYEGTYIDEDASDEEHVLARQAAARARDVSPYQRSSVWWGLQNPWPFPEEPKA